MPILWRFAWFKQWPRIGRSCQTTVLPVLYFWAGHSRTVQVNCLKFLGWTWIFNTVCGWEVTPKVWTGHSVQHLLVYSIDCSSLLFTDFWGWGVTTVVELTLTAYCSKAWTVVHETFLTLPIEFLRVPSHFLHNYFTLCDPHCGIYPDIPVFWHSIWHIFILSCIYSDIVSDICSDELVDILFHIYADILFEILSHTQFAIILSDMLSNISSDILIDIYIYTRLYTCI